MAMWKAGLPVNLREGKDMSMAEAHREQQDDMYIAGRRDGFGIAAVVVGIITFVSLLGIEKAVVAIVLGALAMQGARKGSRARRLGGVALILGITFEVALVVLLIVFREEVGTLISALEQLS
jgi:Na+-driven multidrug efflux pump